MFLHAEAASREGIRLPKRWFGAEFIPFDEMTEMESGGVRLSSGALRRLPEPLRVIVTTALSPPKATGHLTEDAAALLAWLEGSWSPLRAGHALLAMATTAGASDIHIEADGDAHRVRLRLAGTMVNFAILPAGGIGTRLIAALKHLAGCLPYRSDVVQEGRIPRAGVAADARASFMPTALGERVALRLFGQLHDLDALGLGPLTQQLTRLLQHRSGLVIIAGPSGGGKTTTVYAALAFLAAHRDGAHLSIEDPGEQRLRIAGIPVDQVELCPERGLTAEAALVGALRQDVDVIALGEVRRPEEARLALEAAHTGRLVIIGLHAGSPAQARQRMCDLGADSTVLDATLRGVLHQHLETIPCPEGPCPRCAQTGRIRRPVATLWTPEQP